MLVVYVNRMHGKVATLPDWRRITPVNSWQHFFDGVQFSAKEFYVKIAEEVNVRQMPNVTQQERTFKEKGVFSDSRHYHRIGYGDFVIDITCAHFGAGSYVSWWLGERAPSTVSKIPILNRLTGTHPEHQSYYQIDTRVMFKSVVHKIIMQILDEYSSTYGYRALSELERVPRERAL